MQSSTIVLFSAFIIGIFGGVLGHLITEKITTIKQRNLIKEFYAVETAVNVSPHSLRKQMGKGDDGFILVDLRSPEEYEREHIIGAINIPAYKTPDDSAYNDVDRIVTQFAQLPQNKEIIVYCYSMPCMTGKKIGKMLTEYNIYVKHLGIGWNEWRYQWDLWNHRHEWDKTKIEDYITQGTKPDKLLADLPGNACSTEEDFGC